VGKIGKSSIKFNYEILKNNEVVAKGYTINVFVNLKTLKSESIPEDLRNELEKNKN